MEIGPGRGILTRRLAACASQVLAVEVDRDLAAALEQESIPNLTVVEADFLEFRPGAVTRRAATDASLPQERLRIAGNLPYNVASPILFHILDLIDAGSPFTDATVMLQREVAERLLAEPGTKDYGVLTVLIRHRARVQRLLNLPPGAFRPPPKVQSTVVRLEFHAPAPPAAAPEVFREVVRAIFTRRRKTLANALLAYRDLSPAQAQRAIATVGMDPMRRPETLSIAELVALSDALAGAATGPAGRQGAPVL